jgi:hypothetical protein
MEVVRYSETSTHIRTPRRFIVEDGNFQFVCESTFRMNVSPPSFQDRQSAEQKKANGGGTLLRNVDSHNNSTALYRGRQQFSVRM